MKNFLFTGTSGVNPIASVSLSSDNSFDLSSIYESVDLGGNLGKKLKIFNNDDNLNPTD
jgi:hypothetical protein